MSRKLKISSISPNFVVFWKYYVKNCNENVNKSKKKNIHFTEYSEKRRIIVLNKSYNKQNRVILETN